MGKKNTRRERGVLWISRDPEDSEGSPENVMLSSDKPYTDGGRPCPHCAKEVGGTFMANKPFEINGDQSFCYDGWLKATGIKVDYGQMLRIKVSVIE